MNDTKLLKAAKLILKLLDAGVVTERDGMPMHRAAAVEFTDIVKEIKNECRDHEFMEIVFALMNGASVLTQTIHAVVGEDYASNVLRADLMNAEEGS